MAVSPPARKINFVTVELLSAFVNGAACSRPTPCFVVDRSRDVACKWPSFSCARSSHVVDLDNLDPAVQARQQNWN